MAPCLDTPSHFHSQLDQAESSARVIRAGLYRIQL
jgi:hypothetical protein